MSRARWLEGGKTLTLPTSLPMSDTSMSANCAERSHSNIALCARTMMSQAMIAVYATKSTHFGSMYCRNLLPVAVFLKMAGNILAGEAFRTAAHSLQNLAGNSFVNTQSLHSTHKLVVQLTCPLDLHHTTLLLRYRQKLPPRVSFAGTCSKQDIRELLLLNISSAGLHPYCGMCKASDTDNHARADCAAA